MSGPYDDIINLPHPTSQRHPRMPIHDRADLTATSRLKKFRELERILVLADGTEIPMEDVVALESGIFQTLI